jgi:hypothetical protein
MSSGGAPGASSLFTAVARWSRRRPAHLQRSVVVAACIAADAVAAFPTWDMRDWLRDWTALALACGLPLDPSGKPRIPSASQQWKRGHRTGAAGPEALFCLTVLTAIRRRLIGARDLIIDSAPAPFVATQRPLCRCRPCTGSASPPTLARLSRAYPALPRLGLAALLSALAGQCP